MKTMSGWLLFAGLSFCVFALSLTGYALADKPELQVLYNFTSGSDGYAPVSTLVVDKAGNLYGTTFLGGGSSIICPSGCGTVFKLSAPSSRDGAWKETVLYRFTGGSDGSGPYAGLVFDKVGNLYGTAVGGGTVTCSNGANGCGVVFELSPPAAPGGAWTETVLHTFSGSDGSNPRARLTFDQAGNLYGTAWSGGGRSGCGSAGCGVVFELMAPAAQGGAWTYSVLHSFSQNGSDGFLPESDVIFDQTGNLYGTTTVGGTGNAGGTVFELETPTWTETILYTFPIAKTGNSGPAAGVIFDQAGNLYGTTEGGGTSDEGTVFELTPSGGAWTESVLFNGAAPASGFRGDLIFDQSNLYGTAAGSRIAGALFRLQDQAGTWKEAEFDLFGAPGPSGSGAGLAFGKFGALYGTAGGGTSLNCRGGCGTVFGVIP